MKEKNKNKDKLGTYTNGKWKFDDKVTACFDNMLERSIPQYKLMRELTFRVGRRFATLGTAVVDLGCSRGGALAEFVDAKRPEDQTTFIGVEISEPMALAATERFENRDDVVIHQIDLRETYPPVVTRDGISCGSSLTLAVLVLQFIPIEHRHRIIKKIYQQTISGGALILVEKVLGNTDELNAMMVREYYEIKRMNGYTDDQIERKRLSLEGVLVPITARWNEDILRESGFRQVDCFWRSLNFAGWIAIK